MKVVGLIDFIIYSINLIIQQKFLVTTIRQTKNFLIKRLKSLLILIVIYLNIWELTWLLRPSLIFFTGRKSDVIGDRAYSNKVEIVKDIANKIIKLYFKKKIFTIGKHVPGHGLSNHDSHFFLPVIKESKEYLFKNDFRCFKNIKSNFLMTAHIIYENLDKNLPATYSSLIIKNIIMSKLKFRGLIMSDDLCMKALSGSIEKKVSKSFEAGCDIILHCSGNFHEMNKLLIVTKFASDSLLAKMNKMFNYNQ